MKCGNCGTENDVGCIFCYQCGLELSKKKIIRVVTPSRLRRYRFKAWILLGIITIGIMTTMYSFVSEDEPVFGQFTKVPLNEYDLEDYSKYRVHAINKSILFSVESFFMTEVDVIYVRAINLSAWNIYKLMVKERWIDGSLVTETHKLVDYEGNYTIEYEFMKGILSGGEITFTLWECKSGEFKFTIIGECKLYVQSD